MVCFSSANMEWIYFPGIMQMYAGYNGFINTSFSTISAIAFIYVQRGWQCSLDFQEQYRRDCGSVKVCVTNFREHITNMWVSCYNGNNDRSAGVLFAQHPWDQGEWLRQNPRYAWVFYCIIRPSPSGAGRTTLSQPGHYPLSKLMCMV